jgi:UDP-3-O-[3-hydroxymyristoyl] glucosamine N-acyltransferase
MNEMHMLEMTLGEIAQLTGASLQGDSGYVIFGAAGIGEATDKDITFLENPKSTQLALSRAGAVFLPPSAKQISDGPPNRLYTETPKWAYAQVLMLIQKKRHRPQPAIVHEKAEIHYESKLGKEVRIGPFSVVEARTLIGDRTSLGAHCYIGHNVRIGKDCVLHPHVVVEDFCELGDRVIVHSGTVIGSDGYGYWTDPKTGEHRKIPQIGRVVIENDVEIGSNVSIDRATTGETRIGTGSKIDNLVQIAHNVIVGKNCLLVSQVGIAGSAKIGHQVVLAGQVGIADHVTIGDGSVIAAQSGVMSDVKSKSILFGYPARPHREALKLQALWSKLPEMYESLKEIRKKFYGE